MAYTTDSDNNYYVGTWSKPPGYSAPYASLNLQNDVASIKADLEAIEPLVGWQHLAFNGDWVNAGYDATREIEIKFANDPVATAVPRYKIGVASGNMTYYGDNGTTVEKSRNNNVVVTDPGNLLRHAIVCTANSFTLVYADDTTAVPNFHCLHFGSMINLNPNSPYGTWANSQCLASDKLNSSFGVEFPFNGTWQTSLTTGRGVPDITCNDGQTAGASGWSTDAHVLQNVANGLGDTGIRVGELENILFAQSTGVSTGDVYTLNTTFDSGFNDWLTLFRSYGTRRVFVRIDKA